MKKEKLWKYTILGLLTALIIIALMILIKTNFNNHKSTITVPNIDDEYSQFLKDYNITCELESENLKNVYNSYQIVNFKVDGTRLLNSIGVTKFVYLDTEKYQEALQNNIHENYIKNDEKLTIFVKDKESADYTKNINNEEMTLNIMDFTDYLKNMGYTCIEVSD